MSVGRTALVLRALEQPRKGRRYQGEAPGSLLPSWSLGRGQGEAKHSRAWLSEVTDTIAQHSSVSIWMAAKWQRRPLQKHCVDVWGLHFPQRSFLFFNILPTIASPCWVFFLHCLLPWPCQTTFVSGFACDSSNSPMLCLLASQNNASFPRFPRSLCSEFAMYLQLIERTASNGNVLRGCSFPFLCLRMETGQSQSPWPADPNWSEPP